MGSPGSSKHSLVHSLQGSRRRTFADCRPSPTFRECYVQVTPFGDRLARCPPGGLSTPRESETQSGSTVKRRTPFGARELGGKLGDVIGREHEERLTGVVGHVGQKRSELAGGDAAVGLAAALDAGGH